MVVRDRAVHLKEHCWWRYRLEKSRSAACPKWVFHLSRLTVPLFPGFKPLPGSASSTVLHGTSVSLIVIACFRGLAIELGVDLWLCMALLSTSSS